MLVKKNNDTVLYFHLHQHQLIRNIILITIDWAFFFKLFHYFSYRELKIKGVILFFPIVDDIVVTAKLDKTLTSIEEERAVLYSRPQPVSSDFGCLTLSYKGNGVHLQLYITQGTVYTRNKMVFERRDVHSKLFATTSIQTPTNIPYMVLFARCLSLNCRYI